MNLSGLMTSALALLAFVVAFYALLARERKTPYITRSIYRLAVGVLVSILLLFGAQLLQDWRLGIGLALAGASAAGSGTTASPLVGWSLRLAIVGVVIFLIAIVGLFFNIWRLHNRDVHFLDQIRIKDLIPVRWSRYQYRRLRRKANYEYKPIPLDHALIRTALAQSGIGNVDQLERVSVVVICNLPPREYDQHLLGLIQELRSKGWRVQYTTCSRHPFELMHQVQTLFGQDWTMHAPHFVVVDAYAPHFGFSDSVHWKQRDALSDANVKFVTSARSYAGIHTATTRAFNLFKKASGGEVRGNTLMIYEGCASLVDLESPEQYRIFLRHVIPSEKMWGGMLTVFIEPTIGTDDQKLIDSYADLVIDDAEQLGMPRGVSDAAEN
jgi:hypothetical protein